MRARTLSALFAFSLVSLGASSAFAATYQVGPSRTIKTLAAVAPMLAPGDLVEVDGDATYGSVTFQKPGTAASKITIRGIAVNGKRPIVSGGSNTIEAQADHYVFEGLELTGGSFRCFYHHADDITLRGSVIHDCPAHGLLGADSDSGSLTMEYVEVYKCGNGTQQHQIYMATDETAHPGSVFRMQHCYVHDGNGGNNVKSRAERNEIYYNWVEGALYHELELIGPDGQDEGLAREDSDVVGNVLVKGNAFHVVRFGGDGTGQTFGRYRFVNNTVVAGQNAVFRLFDGIESVEMHNNVFLRPGGSVNVYRDVEAAWVAGQLIAGSNNWVQTGASNIPAQWTGTLQGASPGLSADQFPQAGSPLIDAGNGALSGVPAHPFPNPLPAPQFHPPIHALQAVGSAVARPVDAVIDIGAFEAGSGGGAGGAAGSGGSSAGSGGSSAGSGGSTAGSGGSTAGSGGSTAGSGGSTAGSGGSTAGSGGSAGKGGAAGTGGSAGKGGSATAGSAGTGGGAAGKGGSASAGKGGTSSAGAGGVADAPAEGDAESTDDGGCGCRVVASGESGESGGSGTGALAGLLGLAVLAGRRRRRSLSRSAVRAALANSHTQPSTTSLDSTSRASALKSSCPRASASSAAGSGRSPPKIVTAIQARAAPEPSISRRFPDSGCVYSARGTCRWQMWPYGSALARAVTPSWGSDIDTNRPRRATSTTARLGAVVVVRSSCRIAGLAKMREPGGRLPL